MVVQLVIRFLAGGLVVSAFAVMGDVLRPKSFAGIFGAAPSVALATLGLTYIAKGPADAALDGRSMIAGAVALCVYGLLTSRLLMQQRAGPVAVASTACLAWFAVALGLWGVFLR